MADLPVQDELIDAAVRFASADLTDTDSVDRLFPREWAPTSVPSLKTCRRIQSEVRDWLEDPEEQGLSATWALIGRDLAAGKQIVDPGIRLSGAVLFRSWLAESETGKKNIQVTFDHWVEKATLRAICGLAVCSIWQADLQDRVGYCERDGCGNYYIDRRSRGERRRYCGEDECNKARGRARTAASRSNK